MSHYLLTQLSLPRGLESASHSRHGITMNGWLSCCPSAIVFMTPGWCMSDRSMISRFNPRTATCDPRLSDFKTFNATGSPVSSKVEAYAWVGEQHSHK